MRRQFANDGGPLLVVDAELAYYWQGNASADSSESIPAGSDYDRACNVTSNADVLPIGGDFGVVVGANETMPTAWWHPLPKGVCLVACAYGNDSSDDLVEGILSYQGKTDLWSHLGSVDVGSGRLLLMHAASEGSRVEVDPPSRSLAVIEDAISAEVQPGFYDVSQCQIELGEGLYTLVRWHSEAPAA